MNPEQNDEQEILRFRVKEILGMLKQEILKNMKIQKLVFQGLEKANVRLSDEEKNKLGKILEKNEAQIWYGILAGGVKKHFWKLDDSFEHAINVLKRHETFKEQPSYRV